ncbi:hypothetical protein FRC07_005218 [Ceratobasidium sp. 392]|nr:hypothetical protein FRC07_005218 [Ceratobasidium sp. 392]
MASQAATDFLTKEIKISNNIVTFRLLSRQLSIHVNDAKRELELFYQASQRRKDPVFATYVLTGVAAPVQSEALPKSPSASGYRSLEETPRHLVVLVPEDSLEATKSRFIGVPSQHVHSLAPVQIKEQGLLTSAAERVRQLDKQKGQDHAAQIGMLLSKEAPWNATSKGKSKHHTNNSMKPTAPVVKPPDKAVTLGRTDLKANATQATKGLTRQNTLSFTGATKKTESLGSKKEGRDMPPKAMDMANPGPPLQKEQIKPVSNTNVTSNSEATSATSKNASPSSVKSTVKPSQAPITTAGRAKRILDSSDEEEPAPTQSRPAFKRKKSHATSDDDGSEYQSTSAHHRSASLQAMMDIDDDGVINGRSSRSPTPEHVPSAREVAAATKAAKAEAKAAKEEASKGVDRKERTSRKRVPKGKRRVIKTRRVKNAKGYMVTEDYSSYEDIDPNELENDNSGADTEPDHGEDNKKQDVEKDSAIKSNGHKAGTIVGSTKRRQSEASSGAKKSKPGTNVKPGQQKLASFFGKKGA